MESFVDTEESVETEIDLDTVYKLPVDSKVIRYKDHFIIVHPEVASWIVTDEEGTEVYQFLVEQHSIEEALVKYSEEAVISVVTQIEAKRFYHQELRTNDELTMYIYLTNNCNIRCRHCYMYAGDIHVDELPVQTWKTVIQDFAEQGGRGITFTGGEVRCYEGFFELLKFSHELGLRNTVLTNGILWNFQDIAYVKEYVDEVQISLDGYDRESYQQVRQYDGFDKVIENIGIFESFDILTSVAITPLYDNIDEFIFNFESFAQEFLEKHQVIFKFNLELLEGRDVKVDIKQNKEYRCKLRDLVERLYPDFYESSFVLNYKENNKRTNCGFGGITLASNGDVYWCNQIFKLSSPCNIKDVSIKSIIEQSKDIKAKISVDQTEECKECSIRYICGGGCRLYYENIDQVDSWKGQWTQKCLPENKYRLLEKMVNCNEYFFEE